MRKFLIILYLLISMVSSARELSSFVVNGEAEIQGMDYQVEWLVENPKKDHRLILDCQSFINGVRYEQMIEDFIESKWMIYLNGEACEYFAVYAKELIIENGNFCLIADHQNKSIEILKEIKFCKESSLFDFK